jgi:type I restriction enzyme S subunit
MKYYSLSECVSIQRGLTFKKSDVVDNSNFRVLRSNNIDYETYSFIDKDFSYLNPNLEIEDKYFTKKNDIIICMSTGSKKHLGKTALVSSNSKYVVGGFLSKISANEEIINSKYLFYFLKNPKTIKLIHSSVSSMTINNLRKDVLNNLQIPVPSLREQEKIVERLDKVLHDVDIAIETTEKNIKNIEDLYLSKSVNIFDSLAESFDNIYLNDACKVERGSSPRPIKQFITNDVTGVNWIKIGDIKEGEKYVTQTKEKITIAGSKKSRQVKKGDLILTNSMSYGRPYIMDIDGYIHDGWFVLRLSENVETEYFYYLLSSPFVQKQFHSLAAGSVVKNISGDLLKKTKVIIPTLDHQLQTSEKLTEISKNTNRFMEINNLKINKLKILKSSILNKFFSVESTSTNT